jgi:DNA-directed RNA polymerase specialized sigma24 family protein
MLARILLVEDVMADGPDVSRMPDACATDLADRFIASRPSLLRLVRYRLAECGCHDRGLADDVLQDFFCERLQKVLATFSCERDFDRYVRACLGNFVYDVLRREGRRLDHEGAPLPPDPAGRDCSAGVPEVLHEEKLRPIREGMPPEDFDLLLKSRSCPLKELAEDRGMSLAALKAALYRALQKARRLGCREPVVSRPQYRKLQPLPALAAAGGRIERKRPGAYSMPGSGLDGLAARLEFEAAWGEWRSTEWWLIVRFPVWRNRHEKGNAAARLAPFDGHLLVVEYREHRGPFVRVRGRLERVPGGDLTSTPMRSFPAPPAAHGCHPGTEDRRPSGRPCMAMNRLPFR